MLFKFVFPQGSAGLQQPVADQELSSLSNEQKFQKIPKKIPKIQIIFFFYEISFLIKIIQKNSKN